MKSTFTFALVVLLAVASSFTVAQKEPNVEAILNNRFVLDGYIKCILEQGKCTKMGEDLREMLPVAIQTRCAQCTEAQKTNLKKVVNFLQMKKPAEWQAILRKYDPNGQFKNFKF